MVTAIGFLSLLWSFSESDIPTFVLPNTAFGLLATLAAPSLTSCPPPPLWSLLRSIPRMLLFNWSNVFIFELANQRLPESVREDSANKPWRPLPQGQITQTQTRRLMLVSIPVVLGLSAVLGVGTESALILLLAWMYNDLGGGDEVSRDVIIAVAYDVFLVASLRIGVGTAPPSPFSTAAVGQVGISATGYTWLAIIGCVIATTMQVQDLKDQVGDRLRGRKTWPIVLGDGVSRKWIAACVPVWSVVCVVFWETPVWVSVFPVLLGLWVCACVLLKNGDAGAWRWWCVWQVALYALPIYHAL
ncbi:UbiA family prenyltransferase [Aspergillus mulundensis]|uniref:Uncharacterized protein n=1 Tax=Aspergillus mulundensis TaxID=1810919 RepID=A0A3D8QJH7_9EURO|nr:Uncharacterized protein DSM5745_10502 [Aspergillus mulundensis]RDW61830.1 Uncharacterized protein DSM5745_10502 [Aspergillus mulundensis]